MRLPRIKVEGEGFYHVVSRIGARRFLLDNKEKRILLGMIRRAATFSGVEVYTHAIMDNHFHLLIRVPRKTEVSVAELRRRVRALYGPVRAALVFDKWEAWNRTGKAWRTDAEQSRLKLRMHDLSQFCKTFKEAYTQDYNHRHNVTGTIWEGRFKSILLEGEEGALMAVAAYIHLNPVRAGAANEASKARNTGYGAACAGEKASRAGLEALVARVFGTRDGNWHAASQACANAMDGKIGHFGETRTEKERKTQEKDSVGEYCRQKTGTADLYVLLRKRRVGFLHGGALGSKKFLVQVGDVLPKRTRRRPPGMLERCSELELASAMGVHEAS